MKLNETTIVSGSDDRTLRVWDLTNDTSRVLNGHTDEVWSVMKLNETTIVSRTGNNTLRVWDLTNDTSRVLNGHTNAVISVMKLNETTIVSGSGDSTLRVWDLTKTFNPVDVENFDSTTNNRTNDEISDVDNPEDQLFQSFGSWIFV